MGIAADSSVQAVEIAPEEIREAFRFSAPAETATHTHPPSAALAAPVSRPRGRLLIAGLLLTACSMGIFTIWDSLARYQAYGVVTASTVDVSTGIDGVLEFVHVREGDQVRHGDVLGTVLSLKAQQELENIEDQIRVAQAELHAETARIRWVTQVQNAELTRSVVDFFEGTTTLHASTGHLDVIRNELTRVQALATRGSAADIDLQRLLIQEGARLRQGESLQQALAVLRERATEALSTPRPGEEQLAPLTARVNALLRKAERVRSRIAGGEVRSPFNGTVLRRYHSVGESVSEQSPLFSVMEQSSIAVDLYLPQHLGDRYDVGDVVELTVTPNSRRIPCHVTSIGSEHRAPPDSIAVYYRRNIRLLPVRLSPLVSDADRVRLSVGALVKLPYL